MSRTIAIGDIHGCATALKALLEMIDLQPSDTLVPLGDYVNRGGETRSVLEQMIDLQQRCRLIPIFGNHDEKMLGARQGGEAMQAWIDSGGDTALDSYDAAGDINRVPAEHFAFLESCLPFYQTDTHIFLHANYDPDVPIEQQDAHTLRWLSMRDYVPAKPHQSGKRVLVGHTPQPDVLDLGYLVAIDTGACKGGWLTAYEVDTKEIWQVDKIGKRRKQKKSRRQKAKS